MSPEGPARQEEKRERNLDQLHRELDALEVGVGLRQAEMEGVQSGQKPQEKSIQAGKRDVAITGHPHVLGHELHHSMASQTLFTGSLFTLKKCIEDPKEQ